VVSGSHDRTLKVWDITSGRCLLTHRGDAALQHVVATSGGIIASDRTGTLWFLAWPHASVP
jgi:WD40 repeat protein